MLLTVITWQTFTVKYHKCFKINQRHFPTTNTDTFRYFHSAIHFCLSSDLFILRKGQDAVWKLKNRSFCLSFEMYGIMQQVSHICTYVIFYCLCLSSEWSGKFWHALKSCTSKILKIRVKIGTEWKYHKAGMKKPSFL